MDTHREAFFVNFAQIRPPQAHLPLSAELIGAHNDFIKFHLTFKIKNTSFGDSQNAIITVITENDGAEYTRVEIPKSTTSDITEFSIFWIVPGQSYTLQIDLDQDDTTDCNESVEDVDLSEGAVFELNEENPIETGIGICSGQI